MEIPELSLKSYAKKTDLSKMEELCPLRKNICVQNNHFVVNNKNDMFNLSETMFGTGIHPRFKVYFLFFYFVFVCWICVAWCFFNPFYLFFLSHKLQHKRMIPQKKF